MSGANLTQLEIPALSEGVNLADGHARQSLSPGQRAIVERLPSLFGDAARLPFRMRERQAQREYFEALGQGADAVEEGRVLSAYSSSVAINVLARCLSERCATVGLVHPTFDNIPDILRSWSLRLVPVAESTLECDDLGGRLPPDLDAVFVTTPNNPTGWVAPRPGLERLAEHCADHDTVLAIDTSFRGFDPRMQYDMYALLDRTGVDYAVVEDTGKLWPMQELKLGFLAFARGSRLGLPRAMSDILLEVSPFVLALVELLARDARSGGFDELHRLVEQNRRCVARAVADTACELPDPDSRVSVLRVRLPAGISASAVWAGLRSIGVSVLPGGPFHWSSAAQGDAYIRVALARDAATIERGMRLVGPFLAHLSEGIAASGSVQEQIDELVPLSTR